MGEGKINKIEELNGIFYAEGASDLGFQNIFAKIESEDLEYILNSSEVSASSSDQNYNQITFKKGELFIPLDNNNIFLDYRNLFFLFPKKSVSSNENIKTKNWFELIDSANKEIYLAEILERFSLSLMLIISVLIAVPLSLRMFENGRFLLIFSGLIIFLSYYGLVVGKKVFVEQGIFDPIQIFVITHCLYFALALFLIGLDNFKIEPNSLISTKYSNKWFAQVFFLLMLLIIFLNFLFF